MHLEYHTILLALGLVETGSCTSHGILVVSMKSLLMKGTEELGKTGHDECLARGSSKAVGDGDDDRQERSLGVRGVGLGVLI